MAELTARVAVLGGGISGLSAAYFLAKKHADPTKIVVVEASPRLGGWMHSTKSSSGAIFEKGPRSLRPAGPAGVATLKLASELDLENQIIPVPSSHIGAQNRFIYSKGKVHKLPNSIMSIIKKQSLYSSSLLPTILKEPFVKRKSDDSDETVYDFFCRRLNKDLADRTADPMLRGIFAGDVRLLSLKSALKPVYDMERDHGSVVKAALFPRKPAKDPDTNPLVQRSIKENWSIWSLQGGLQTFANKLHEALVEMGVQVVKDMPCKEIEFPRDGSVLLKAGKDNLVCDHVISSLSSDRLAHLLGDSHAVLKTDLNSIPSVSVGLVNLEYKGNIIKDGGFGVLVPSSEPVKVLGIIYDSCVFPEHDSKPGDSTRLTVMMGGHWFQEHLGHPDTVTVDTLTDTALNGVSKILGITQDPVCSDASVQKNCISQYTVGHNDRVDKIFSYVRNNELPLSLIGASYKGVSVNDCVFNAQKAVEEFTNGHK